MRRLHFGFLPFGLLLIGIGSGCDPDLRGKTCDDDTDCLTTEYCNSSGICTRRSVEDPPIDTPQDPDIEATDPDVTIELPSDPVGEADLVPDAVDDPAADPDLLDFMEDTTADIPPDGEVTEVELNENCHFDSPISVGWTDIREGVGGTVETVSVDGHPTALHLDSRFGGNYYLWYYQVVDVTSFDVASILFSWDWRVDEIESPYGLTVVSLSFFKGGDTTADFGFRYQRTGGSTAYECPGFGTTLDCHDDTDGFATASWSSHSMSLGEILGRISGADPYSIHRVEVRITSYNNAGFGADMYFDDVCLTAIPTTAQELLENGGFDSPITTGWTDNREGEGGTVEIVPVDEHPTALHLDSRAGGNYYLWFTQVVDVTSFDVADILFSWDWRVDEIESPYGLTQVSLSFFEAGDDTTDYSFRYQRTGDSTIYDCAESGATGDCIDDTAGFTTASWSSHSIRLGEILGRLSGADPDSIQRVEVRITSYNNAGSGADMYFDNLSLVAYE